MLLGMMGCGKSAIGKMVARKLGLEFKDADTEIEAAAGRTVTAAVTTTIAAAAATAAAEAAAAARCRPPPR